MPDKILVVDDEQEIADLVTLYLQNDGYEVYTCYDAHSALTYVDKLQLQLAILDVMLPGKNGFEIAKEVRESGIKTPILMLTAKSDVDDKVEGLDRGADDYLTKPFMTKELLARLRALVRRTSNSSDGTLSFGDITLNTNSSSLICSDNSVRLSEKEFHILEYLILNQGQILTREQIATKIWGYESNAEYNNVEVYMSFVRKKLSFIKAKTEIKAVRGIGYELRYDNV